MLPFDFLRLRSLINFYQTILLRRNLKVVSKLFLTDLFKLLQNMKFVIFSFTRKYQFFSDDFIVLFKLQLIFAVLLKFFLSLG